MHALLFKNEIHVMLQRADEQHTESSTIKNVYIAPNHDNTGLKTL